MDETRLRTRSRTFTLSDRFIKKRARLGGLAKAAVQRDKLARRKRWRLAKAKQRAAKREAAPMVGDRLDRTAKDVYRNLQGAVL
jgi:hypothetical protein